MKASATSVLRAPKNSGSVLGNAMWRKTAHLEAPRERTMSRYLGSSVEGPTDTGLVSSSC
jgi:hypothetical protein